MAGVVFGWLRPKVAGFCDLSTKYLFMQKNGGRIGHTSDIRCIHTEASCIFSARPMNQSPVILAWSMLTFANIHRSCQLAKRLFLASVTFSRHWKEKIRKILLQYYENIFFFQIFRGKLLLTFREVNKCWPFWKVDYCWFFESKLLLTFIRGKLLLTFRDENYCWLFEVNQCGGLVKGKLLLTFLKCKLLLTLWE